MGFYETLLHYYLVIKLNSNFVGCSLFSDPEGYIFVDNEIIGEKGKITSLIVLFFAVFYIFNLQYPEGASLTMEFFQRYTIS